MEAPGSSSTELVVTAPMRGTLETWPEAVDTPGILPRHLIRQTSAGLPFLEILHRLLYRIQPDTHSNLDNVLAAIALYSAAVPVYKFLKDFAFWAFTVQVTIPEHDP
jgi:chaperone BCS1